MNRKITRRSLFAVGGILASGIVGGSLAKQQSVANQTVQPAESSSGVPAPMPERVLGKTGIPLPILGLGGAGQTPLSWEGQEAQARAIIEAALNLGIRYFDTAASYGPSEDYLGRALPTNRKNLFIASKTSARDRDGAWRDLERSLKRLKADYLDSWQLHHVSFASELDEIFGKNGAIRAVEEAKQQKLIRFSGITGHHDPAVIAEGLRRYPFDTTLVSLNAADPHHPNPFAPTVLPVAQEKKVGVIAMKIPAYGRILKPNALNMQQAMGYVLSLAGVQGCVIAAETVEQLEQNVQVARGYQPLNSTEMNAIAQLTAPIWQETTFFRAWH
ncbi:MAG: aldo/keto reductase [Oscillatoriales cyanobacterium C42_A2020_001]|nr:aldo/keto reductase [Leptolyngbyaceae cyanobacterium C42_A2020_001]